MIRTLDRSELDQDNPYALDPGLVSSAGWGQGLTRHNVDFQAHPTMDVTYLCDAQSCLKVTGDARFVDQF